MKLNKIHHIAMIVSDYEKSKKFYTEQLGFQILRENYREDRGDYKLDLKQGDCELEIFFRKRTSRKAVLSGSMRTQTSHVSC